MELKASIVFPSNQPPVVTPPPGEYYQLMRDYETGEYVDENGDPTVRPTAPAPATMKSLRDVWIEMPKELQMFLWACWCLMRPPGITDQRNAIQWDGYWHSATAWTNIENGSDVCASYPTGRNLDKRPMARETLGCRGMTVKLRDGWTEQDKQNNLWWPFDAITADAPSRYTPEQFVQMWWLCGTSAIQTAKQLADGTYQVDLFPQRTNIETGQANDVFCPLLSQDGTLWFRKDRIRYTGDGVRANPYNPPREYSPKF